MKITIEVEIKRGYYTQDNYSRWIALPTPIDFLLAWLTKVAKTIYSVEQKGVLESVGFYEKGKIYEVVYEPKEFPLEPIEEVIKGLYESLSKEEHVSHANVKEKKLEFSKREWNLYLTKVMMQKVTK